MEFKRVLALRGPNIWAKFSVLEAWVDLGAYKDAPSDQLPGLNDRLMAWLPSLIEYRCSVGVRGGFLERLRQGTWLGHILEHVTLELQCLAGTEVGFGRTRETSKPGVYKVVVEYQDEQLARAALETGHRLCLAAIKDEPFDVAEEIEKLRAIYRRVAPKPDTAALLQAAKSRDIPVRFLNADGLIQLGFGSRQHRLQGAQTDRTSATAESIARDNHLTRTLLHAVGVPVAPGETVRSAADAWEEAQDVGLPVSIRPRYGKERRPEWNRLETQEQVQAAYRAASDDGDDPVLVERVLAGSLHYFLVVGDRVVSAVRRVGDRRVEVMPWLHHETAARAVEAARVVGLDVAGVEVIAEDVSRPLEDQGGAVLAVRAQPDLNEFLKPDEGEPQPVAEAIVATLFPEGDNGRVPVVAITGTNGKTTTTRLIAHIFGRVWGPIGMGCSEGIYLGDRLLESGDCSGPKTAKAVLGHPEAGAAVLETARGGILREGLGFDQCHVAVVTNVHKADHLGLNDIKTAEGVAEVKGTIVEAVMPSGAAVLNATDPLTVAMAENCPGAVIFFARDGEHPLIVQHRVAGKRVAFVRDNHIVLAEGAAETVLVSLVRVPLTHGGRVGFNVENSLAAAAAAWAVAVPFADIRAGLETFSTALEQSPGRFNLLQYNGATVVMDYAHNISALESFLEVLRHFPHPRRTVVYAVPGDRTDEVITTQGQMLGDAYDRVLLYEDTELRGRAPGSIFALMRAGLAKSTRVREILDVNGNMKAIDMALASVGAGDLLVIQPEFPDVAAEYFARIVAAGAREVTLERACGIAAGVPVNVR